MMITRVGIDIAKSVFHVHGVDRHDQVRWTGKYARHKWLDALCQRVPVGAEVGIEACGSSHHWARELQARGYLVKLVAAHFVGGCPSTRVCPTFETPVTCRLFTTG